MLRAQRREMLRLEPKLESAEYFSLS